MHTPGAASVDARRRWMGILAKAAPGELESVCGALGTLPAYTWLRPPETGLVMVRGRIGGTGAKFNVGEMTVTRCTLRTDSGLTGFAYVRGRDARHAELAAIVDAMMQDAAHTAGIASAVIVPLERLQDGRRRRAAGKAAATRVEFYTVVRSAAA